MLSTHGVVPALMLTEGGANLLESVPTILANEVLGGWRIPHLLDSRRPLGEFKQIRALLQ
jgi:hypothetical protein